MKKSYNLYQTSNGIYYFRFKVGNVDHRRSTRTRNKREAEKIADNYYKTVKGASTRDKAIVRKELERIVFADNKILLTEAFSIFEKKPRKKAWADKNRQKHKSQWSDFVSFMASRYPNVKTLVEVTRDHAEEYIQFIRENGKFDKNVIYTKNSKTFTVTRKSLNGAFSATTANKYHTAMQAVFEKLLDNNKYNPFAKIEKASGKQISKQPFEREEMDLIFNNADNFIKPMIIIGLFTGLRRGDICTLKWSDIDFKVGKIETMQNKTSNPVKIPIFPELLLFLKEQYKKTGDNEYVLPEHAEIYFRDETSISQRFKDLLDSLNIKNTIITKNGRTQSIKGFHSLRHQFCYEALKQGVDSVIVQSIVGHTTLAMTQRYQDHFKFDEVKAVMFEKMGGVLAPSSSKQISENINAPVNQVTAELLEQLKHLPADKWQSILEIINK